jgi:hypothetical protein
MCQLCEEADAYLAQLEAAKKQVKPPKFTGTGDRPKPAQVGAGER